MTIARTAEVAPISTDHQELQELEAIVKKGLETFIEVGSALMTIKEKKLYRHSYKSWDKYCEERWGFSRMHASRVITAADIVKTFIDGEDAPKVIPASESIVRPIASLSRPAQKQAWNEAVEAAGGKQPTAKQVERAAARHKPAPRIKAPEATLDEAIEQVAEEPKDIAAQRKAGVIPSTSRVEVTHPNGEPEDQEDDTPEDATAGMDDDDFLRACPARGNLDERCKKIFDADALGYKHITAARIKFHFATMKIRARTKDPVSQEFPPYISDTNYYLKRRAPKDWVACRVCQNSKGLSTGKEALTRCRKCHGSGYYAG